MCAICSDFNGGKLTVLEAFQNLSEMETTIPKEHYQDVLDMLNDEWDTQSSLGMGENLSEYREDEPSEVDEFDYEHPWSGYSEYDQYDD